MLGRWGGRFSLIVPCVSRKILPAYWPWLDKFGPDIVYSYVPLSDHDVLEGHERLAPSAYMSHRLAHEPRLDVYGFKPSYDATLLSSLSLVFKLARYAPAARDGAPVKIIDCWFAEHHRGCLPTTLVPTQIALEEAFFLRTHQSLQA
jgi:hypothetical protein